MRTFVEYTISVRNFTMDSFLRPRGRDRHGFGSAKAARPSPAFKQARHSIAALSAAPAFENRSLRCAGLQLMVFFDQWPCHAQGKIGRRAMKRVAFPDFSPRNIRAGCAGDRAAHPLGRAGRRRAVAAGAGIRARAWREPQPRQPCGARPCAHGLSKHRAVRPGTGRKFRAHEQATPGMRNARAQLRHKVCFADGLLCSIRPPFSAFRLLTVYPSLWHFSGSASMSAAGFCFRSTIWSGNSASKSACSSSRPRYTLRAFPPLLSARRAFSTY